MEKRMFKVYAKNDEKIQLKVIPGHYRVAMRQLEETPAEGMYVTREEARGYAILTAALGALLFLMILFKGRKK